MKVSIVSITTPVIPEVKTAEDLIVYCARVSNPENQLNFDTGEKLIKYMIMNGHWSPFEMASMCVEIETSHAIAKQILRHRSFSFQEQSLRYSSNVEIEHIEPRLQGANRQGGETYTLLPQGMLNRMGRHINASISLYGDLLDLGIARECARMVLPLAGRTRLYMNGTIRSWIHYLQQRLDEHAQKEHRLIAQEIANIFKDNFPTIYKVAIDEPRQDIL